MINSIAITNFRNLRNVTLKDLGRITLVAGKNGTGKTSLLEAVWLLSGSDLPELSLRMNMSRGFPVLSPPTIFHDLFHNFNVRQGIKIAAGRDVDNVPRVLEILLQQRQETDDFRPENLDAAEEWAMHSQSEDKFELVFKAQYDERDYTSRAWWVNRENGSGATETGTLKQKRDRVANRASAMFMPAVYRENLNTVASRFGALQLRGEDTEILKLLRLLEPGLERLVPITLGNTVVVHAYLKGSPRPLPLRLLGDGVNRIFDTVLAIGEERGGFLLIDEIENGLRHTVQKDVFATLLDWARKFDVQIFATTHSAECIKAAYQALKGKEPQDFAFYRLDRIGNEVKPVHIDCKMLETAFFHKMEIR